MSDDSDAWPQQKRKRKLPCLDSPTSSTSSGSSCSPVVRNLSGRRPRGINIILEDTSDSESGSSLTETRRKIKVRRVGSDSSSGSSSSSSIIKRTRRPACIRSESESYNEESDRGFEGSSSSQWESDFPDDEPEDNAQIDETSGGPSVIKNPFDSDSSDGQSEKCPICLLSFKTQEIGTPESCDHMFCLECIQEWSKNMNTCPVDRQEFRLILIRRRINGKVIRRLQIEKPVLSLNDVEIIEDNTCCEICGSRDSEDRMLLCDGCNLGFHLFCLAPPLETVPEGLWHCNSCLGIVDDFDRGVVNFDMVELNEMYELRTRDRSSSRLVPRTRQSERVRRRIATNRQNVLATSNTNNHLQEVTTAEAVSSTTTSRKRKRKKRRKTTYKIVYEIDKTTGETVAVKKRKKQKRRRVNRRLARERAKTRTVKKRLAAQLGMCAPRQVPQNLPDVKVQTNSNSIGSMRHQAGIPTLHLFGQANQLDYFSQDEDEYADDDDIDGDGDVLTRRVLGRNVFRRLARRKEISLPNAVSSTSDLLGNILDCQERFYSKNTVFSLNPNGTLKMEKKNNNYINLGNQSLRVRQTPLNYSNRNSEGPTSLTSNTSTSSNYNSSTSESHSTPSSSMETANASSAISGSEEQETPTDYTQRPFYDNYEQNEQNKKKNASEENTGSNTPNSGSEVDIYSDIETVSTSKVEDVDYKPLSPSPVSQSINTDDENDSEPDMVIDTEKVDMEKLAEDNKEEPVVTSTVDSNIDLNAEPSSTNQGSLNEIQSGAVQSSVTLDLKNAFDDDDQEEDEDDLDSEDGCPNFSIYSKESINLAKNTDISLSADDDIEVPPIETNQVPVTSPIAVHVIEEEYEQDKPNSSIADEPIIEQETPDQQMDNELSEFNTENIVPVKIKESSGLYSDSEDETIVKKDNRSFGLSDIRNMTEDISEEERSYTPCLDEKTPGFQEGLEGLDTEMISDEERNDFDESHELKTASDGDALEINAKESELDFTRPEDYEEGEIIDKSKGTKKTDSEKKKPKTKKEEEKPKSNKKKDKTSSDNEKSGNKENENQNKEASFKKLSKSSKERNYRDRENKEKERSRSRDKKTEKTTSKSEKRDKKKEKRKEIARYNVRALIAVKPRRDRFGRDIQRTASRSKTRSLTPPALRRSKSRSRRSPSKDRSRKRRGRSRNRRSGSRSRTRTPEKKRSRSKTKKRKRSASRVEKRRKSGEKIKKKARSRSRRRSKSPSPRRKREWNKRLSRDWSPSVSRSQTPERHMSPSWTPPRTIDNSQAVKGHNLTVILNNDPNRKKKEKKKKTEKKTKETDSSRAKKRRHCDRTPPPSKEVFASGDNILVSVSFNKENETRDVTTRDRRRKDTVTEEAPPKKVRREKQKKKRKDLSSIKPVAIIDLERSPFKELTPSPKDIIVLSDSDNGESGVQKGACDSSQQVASPEGNSYAMGPKTPPEPQVKFSLAAKQPALRAINNPLHEPEDMENTEEEVQQEQRMGDSIYKGPNTPPEPPTSPPSSPDAYDPFEPTKSRSPTPEPLQTTQTSNNTTMDETREDSIMEKRSDVLEKTNSQQADVRKSLTPPVADIQPADSQSSIQVTPESNIGKSPERIGVVINQVVQPTATVTSKPVAQTTPFSSVPTSMITSTPVSSNLSTARMSILNSTLLTSPHIATAIPQRIVLPNVVKSNPVKISPTKPTIKSTPIKPMPSKNTLNKPNRKNRSQNGNDDSNMDLDSPYSPGSSDYEDLFEPPVENAKGPSKPSNKMNTKSPVKTQNNFDNLFGSPIFNKNKNKNDNNKFAPKKPLTPSKGGTKQIGVKLDEDNLKILDELPNSAVEMQVKDKFLKKLNRQERVVEEVKLVLKPHYNKKRINKEEYKDILRRAVPKICHNKSGEINPTKIKNLIEAYVKKIRHSKKVTSSSSVNPQKV